MRVFIHLVFFHYFIWMCLCLDLDDKDKLDRYIIACHTTDLECFKLQYKSLRDKVLLGNDQLKIPYYEPYIFKYGDTGTCIKLTGWEESQLTGIQIDSLTKQFTWTVEMPFKIQQIRSSSIKCQKPENDFVIAGNQFGTLKQFSGNATIKIVYPFELRKKKQVLYMILKDENLDLILDIPDLSHYNRDSSFERKLYDLSEWAYGVVQHIDAAQYFALPYTMQLRVFTEIVPLNRLLLLYPEEEYEDLQMKYVDFPSKGLEKINIANKGAPEVTMHRAQTTEWQ